MIQRSRLVVVLLGAVVSVVLSFIPFASILGGGVAGYLYGPDLMDGARVGGHSGGLAAIPVALIVILFFGFLGIGNAPVFFGAFALFAFVLSIVFTIAGSAVGGLLGAYVNDNWSSESRPAS